MKLSVIVPVYNTSKYLDRCISSILNQSFNDFELLLIDDGSTDNSGEICDEYAKKDSRIKVVHKHNEGLGLTRNCGLSLAAGKYVYIADSDDYMHTDMFRIMVEYAEKYSADCVSCGYYRAYDDGRLVKFSDTEEVMVCNESGIKETIMKRLLAAENKGIDKFSQSVWTKLYLRSSLAENNMLFKSERQYLSEDFLFNYEYFSLVSTVVCIPDCLYYYADNSSSITNSYRPTKVEAGCNLYREMAAFDCIKTDPEAKRQLAANVLGLISVQVKLLVASNEKNKMKTLHSVINNTTVAEMASLSSIPEMKFPLSLFCFLIKHKMKYTLYLLISTFLKLQK